MKAWFVFMINGKRVATWAQDYEEAEANIIKKYGNVSMEYVGNTCHDPFMEPLNDDEITTVNMSCVDKMIAFGIDTIFLSLLRKAW